jgi:DNA-directed RNA polymerase specialized sigma24 family protein
MRDHPGATVVMRARNGDELAWDALVDRYAPLIWSLCRRYRPDGAGAGDAGQNVWLQLAHQLGEIRDPALLPGWLATTTRRECQRILNRAPAPHETMQAVDADNIPDDQASTPERGSLRPRPGDAMRSSPASQRRRLRSAGPSPRGR